jgi:hypothetical protein
MRNKLSDLQNHLFEMIEMLNDTKLKGEKLKEEITRALAVNELAKTAVTNGALMVKCVDLLYGIPVSDEVPLIPKSKEEVVFINKQKTGLLALPKARDDGTSGYKRGRQQPI